MTPVDIQRVANNSYKAGDTSQNNLKVRPVEDFDQ